MSKQVFIYALKDPRDNSIFYIGQTTNMKDRINRHIYKAKANPQLKGKNEIIRDLIANNLTPTYDIIETCNDNNWAEREIYWIDYYQKLHGIENVTAGGESSVFKRGVTAWNKGLTGIYTDESRARMAEAKLGTKASEETKRKMSLAQTGRTHTEESIEKMRERATPVLQYDLEGNFIKEYRSIRIALEDFENNPEIGMCCTGKIRSSGGYVWKYKTSEEFPLKIDSCNTTPKSNPIIQMDLDKNGIKIWGSAKECAKETGYNIGNIRMAAKAESLYRGFYWKYIITRGVNN